MSSASAAGWTSWPSGLACVSTARPAHRRRSSTIPSWSSSAGGRCGSRGRGLSGHPRRPGDASRYHHRRPGWQTRHELARVRRRGQVTAGQPAPRSRPAVRPASPSPRRSRPCWRPATAQVGVQGRVVPAWPRWTASSPAAPPARDPSARPDPAARHGRRAALAALASPPSRAPRRRARADSDPVMADRRCAGRTSRSPFKAASTAVDRTGRYADRFASARAGPCRRRGRSGAPAPTHDPPLAGLRHIGALVPGYVHCGFCLHSGCLLLTC